MVLTFCGLDHQWQICNEVCPKNGDSLEARCVRGTAGIASSKNVQLLSHHGRKHIDLSGTVPLGCTCCTYSPHFLPLVVASDTMWFTVRIASEGIASKSYLRRPISQLKVLKESHRHSLTINRPHVKKFLCRFFVQKLFLCGKFSLFWEKMKIFKQQRFPGLQYMYFTDCH